MKYIYILCFLSAFALSAFAGGVNRSTGMGDDDIAYGSDPKGVSLPHNLGAKIKIKGIAAKLSSSFLVPDISYSDGGDTHHSKQLIYALPQISFAQRVDEDTVVGIDIDVEYGMGASFQKIMFGMDSSSLVSGTYIKPFICKRLTDTLSVGVGPIFCETSLKLEGPVPLGSLLYAPVKMSTEMTGIGYGFQVGAYLRLTSKLGIGINYMSSITTEVDGRLEISNPVHLRTKAESEFQFPDRLDLAFDYELSEDEEGHNDWMVVGQLSLTGYSRNSGHTLDLRLPQWLGLTDSKETNWQDVLALYLGVSHVVSDDWTIGCGFAWMTSAIHETVGFWTPDGSGLVVAVRTKHQLTKSMSVALCASYVVAGQKEEKEVNVKIPTITVGFHWDFNP